MLSLLATEPIRVLVDNGGNGSAVTAPAIRALVVSLLVAEVGRATPDGELRPATTSAAEIGAEAYA